MDSLLSPGWFPVASVKSPNEHKPGMRMSTYGAHKRSLGIHRYINKTKLFNEDSYPANLRDSLNKTVENQYSHDANISINTNIETDGANQSVHQSQRTPQETEQHTNRQMTQHHDRIIRMTTHTGKASLVRHLDSIKLDATRKYDGALLQGGLFSAQNKRKKDSLMQVLSCAKGKEDSKLGPVPSES